MYVQILKLITARPLRSVTVISDFEPALTASDDVFPEDAEGAVDLKALLTDETPADPLADREDGAVGGCQCRQQPLRKSNMSAPRHARSSQPPAPTNTDRTSGGKGK